MSLYFTFGKIYTGIVSFIGEMNKRNQITFDFMIMRKAFEKIVGKGVNTCNVFIFPQNICVLQNKNPIT